MIRLRRKRTVRVYTVLPCLLLASCAPLGSAYHSQQFSRVAPMEGAGPIPDAMPPEITFHDFPLSGCGRGRSSTLDGVSPVITLDTASRRLHWTIRLDGRRPRLAATLVDTDSIRRFGLLRVQLPDVEPDVFAKARYCQKTVELNLGAVSNGSHGEAVLSEAQMTDLIDGRWAVRFDAPGGGVLMTHLWVPYDAEVPSLKYRTVSLEAEPRDPTGPGKLWPDGDVDVSARVDTRTRLLEFGINGKLRGAGTVHAVRFYDPGTDGNGAVTDQIQYLEDEYHDAAYFGTVTLTDAQMAAALDQRMRIGIELNGHPGREGSGFLYLHGYTDHTPAQGYTPLEKLRLYLWFYLTGFRPGGG